MVKNLPSNARDTGSITGQGTKIPHATRQLESLHAATTEPLHSRALGAATKCPHTTTEIQLKVN